VESGGELMGADLFNALSILIYLASGVIGIVLLAGWLLKRFGPPK
jgi:flagellar biogenesis protein FliO